MLRCDEYPWPHILLHMNLSFSKASQVALMVKNLPVNGGDIDAGSTPGLGRSPGGGYGNPLQYSCLEDPMDRGAWQATVHRVTKSQTRLKWLGMHTCMSFSRMHRKHSGFLPRFYDPQVQLIPQLLWVLAPRDSQLLIASRELLHPGSYKLPTPAPHPLHWAAHSQWLMDTANDWRISLIHQWLMDKPMTEAKAWPLPQGRFSLQCY